MYSEPPESFVELRPLLNSAGAVRSTSSPGLWTGSELSTSWWRSEKIAVFAPMPSASDSTTTKLSIGAFPKLRRANRIRPISLIRREILIKRWSFSYEQRDRHPKPDQDHDAAHHSPPHPPREPG